jgi:hypothetical protein
MKVTKKMNFADYKDLKENGIKYSPRLVPID